MVTLSIVGIDRTDFGYYRAKLAHALLEIASQARQGRAVNVAGPQTANLVDLARAFVARHGPALDVQPDTAIMAGIPDGALIAGPEARTIGPGYADWLESADAAALREQMNLMTPVQETGQAGPGRTGSGSC